MTGPRLRRLRVWTTVLAAAAVAGIGAGALTTVRLPAPPAGVQGLAFPDTGVWTGREFLFPGAAGLVALIPSR